MILPLFVLLFCLTFWGLDWSLLFKEFFAVLLLCFLQFSLSFWFYFVFLLDLSLFFPWVVCLFFFWVLIYCCFSPEFFVWFFFVFFDFWFNPKFWGSVENKKSQDYDEWWMIITVWPKNTYICTDSWHLYRLVKTSICTGILLTTVYGLDFRHRRSHVHMIISDGQQSFIPRTKPWKPQDHDDLRCQVVAFLSQLPRGPKVT